MRSFVMSLAACAALAIATSAQAQQPPAPPAYGEAINIEQAKKVAAAAVAEAKKNNWGMCVSVVAPSGDLVYFERMDNCQYASINISKGFNTLLCLNCTGTSSFGISIDSGLWDST